MNLPITSSTLKIHVDISLLLIRFTVAAEIKWIRQDGKELYKFVLAPVISSQYIFLSLCPLCMVVLLRRVNELRRSYFLAKRNDNSFITYYRICNQNQNQQHVEFQHVLVYFRRVREFRQFLIRERGQYLKDLHM